MTFDLSKFQGCRESLHWNQWDLKGLDMALGLTPGRKVAVQAGGNLGVFAAYLAEQFEAVYTFEPDGLLFPLLVSNAPAENIIRFQAALGEGPAMIGTQRTTPTQTHAGVTHVSGEGIIPTMKLDDLHLPACDLLYLDIEGYELFALRGAEQTIKAHRPVIALEINACCERYGYAKADLLDLMEGWGYRPMHKVHNDHIFVPNEAETALNLVAVRVGDKYGPEYVEKLFDQLIRNLSTVSREIRCWCITDDPESLPDYVNAIPHNPDLPGWWQKVWMFSEDMPWAEGERTVYFDLDLCITGPLEELVERQGIIRDWLWENCYNSSVMVWNHGDHPSVWDTFDPVAMALPGQIVPPHALPDGQINGGDQEWITTASGWHTFPPEWCVNYRSHALLWPPEGAKVVSFNGKTKPADVTEGWVPTVWKVGGLTSLPEMKGVNTTKDQILDNVRSSVQRDIPWFTSCEAHNKTAILCCGGPSLKESLPEIRAHKRRGGRIISVNNTLRYLMSEGIMPHHHIMLDARPENAEFVKDAPQQVRYFLASQVDPSVFDALKDHDVILWHNAIDGDAVETIAQPYATDAKPLIGVPGGCTVGLRAIWLAYAAGYRKLHIYGMDGSYRADQHHAYPQPLNDGETVLNVVMGGKEYLCAKWMARQANDFQQAWRDATRFGMSIFVHGDGIIPDIARTLRSAEQKAA